MKLVKKFLKISGYILLALLALAIIVVLIFSLGSRQPADKINWGVNFSQKHAQALGLDWQEAYLAILDDLGARNIRLAAHWDIIEKSPDVYDFQDLDWQIDTAATRNASIILAVGMKTPRWPECHIPAWAEKSDVKKQQEFAKEFIQKTIARYRPNKNIIAWQIENEPFFYFGECPPKDDAFFASEVAAARKADPYRKIMVTDSGEFSSWFKAASLADIVGTTLYREAYFHRLKMFLKYPLTPVFYRRKAQLVGWLYGKKAVPVEIQAEPWFQSYPLGQPGEKNQDFTLAKFKDNIEFVRQTGFDEAYLWGAEWWYYQKTKSNEAGFWEEAKKLFP